jgi:uncharacterized protein (DUF2062 family)
MACGLFAVIFIATYKTGIWIATKLRRSASPKTVRTANSEQPQNKTVKQT